MRAQIAMRVQSSSGWCACGYAGGSRTGYQADTRTDSRGRALLYYIIMDTDMRANAVVLASLQGEGQAKTAARTFHIAMGSS